MITLITGLPGSGKSVELVLRILEARKAGRTVYACGIDGLQDDLAERLDNPRAWQELPDGALIVVDEAQKVWPSRRSREPDADVTALSEHRHHGFDFVIATQHPTMIDAYVRRLTGEHIHLVRRWGSKWVTRFRWNEVVEDPQALSLREKGEKVAGRIDPTVFKLYKSASLHTVKPRIPFKLLMLPVVLLVGAFFLWFALGMFEQAEQGVETGPNAASPQGLPASAPSRSGGLFDDRNGSRRTLTRGEYLERLVPRVEGVHWTAPIFDGRPVAAEPRTLCIINESNGGTCRCYTEQVTRLSVEPARCRELARYGFYDPHRSMEDDPRERRRSNARGARQDDQRAESGSAAS